MMGLLVVFPGTDSGADSDALKLYLVERPDQPGIDHYRSAMEAALCGAC